MTEPLWIAAYYAAGVLIVIVRLLLELRATGWRISDRDKRLFALRLVLIVIGGALLWLPVILLLGLKELFTDV